MAQMYPEQLDPETKSGAERLLYELFREQLDETYLVFHSVHWQANDRRGNPRDGEADFVLAHPERGILTLEVKGGGIHRDPHSGGWTSTSAAGVVAPIKNPLEQAKDSKYSLLDLLKQALRRFVFVGHAVAFPDIVVGDRYLGPDLPRQIVLDATDLSQLSRWVERAMDYWRGSRTIQQSAPGKDALRELRRSFGRQWSFKPALWGQVSQERQVLIHLTQEQFVLLDLLNRQRQVVISGFAGSGKTLLAAEKATRLAHQGFRVLLTCFNRSLAEELRQRLPWGANLDIYHFHGLCTALAREAGLTVPSNSEQDRAYFERRLAETLKEAAHLLRHHYDAIIVDEAQDFYETWWIALLGLLVNIEHGILYLFADDNQRIYTGTSELPLDTPPYLLTRNCRTTQCIHEQILRFYRGEQTPTAPGPKGRPVEIVSYEAGGLQSALVTLLARLVGEEGVPSKEILVLTPYSHQKSQTSTARLPGSEIGIGWAAPLDGRDFVQVSTIYAAKGLERPVVVLVELERVLKERFKAVETERLLYVACSRASHHLVVILPRPTPPAMQSFFLVHGEQEVHVNGEEPL